jgi:hypothetical protein
MKSLAVPFLAALAISLLFTNCASLTGFMTGRTVGANRGEFMATLNASQTPDFDLDGDESDSLEIDNYYFPNLELSGRYGIVDKIDIGLKVNSNFNLALDARFQLIGDQYSPFALSAGAGFGTFALFAALYNVQIPLYLSVHPSETVAIYVSPRYVAQFAAGDISGSINYFGGNAGILIGGEKVKFGIDAGYYDIGKEELSFGIATFGLGVKVPLGNNYSEER